MKKTICFFLALFILTGCGILPPPDPTPKKSSYYWYKEQRVQDKILEDDKKNQVSDSFSQSEE